MSAYYANNLTFDKDSARAYPIFTLLGRPIFNWTVP
jgi:hypothetical protein